jgi:hypothetical protein
MSLGRFAIRAWIVGHRPGDKLTRELLPERYDTAWLAQKAADDINGRRLDPDRRVAMLQVVELLEGGGERTLPRREVRN